MKNITVTIDDEIYLEARVFAAYHSTSVSALVRDFLFSLTCFPDEEQPSHVGAGENPVPPSPPFLR
jgi:plasmid stability protein